jgi:DNA-binding MarR family transcriptional regulator
MAVVGTPQRALNLARLLTLVERRVMARLATTLEATGGTVEEWRIMSLLSDDRGHAMSEIAEFALLPPPTLTKVVDRMVSANLVYRRGDEVDRRRVLVFLSARGKAAYHRQCAATEHTWNDVAGTVGEEELTLLGALLARAADRLGQRPGD